ncbi:phage late control D family protein [Cronobacter dublinensis]|nr:phage late control D family protein [Cronobacter dublinensis]
MMTGISSLPVPAGARLSPDFRLTVNSKDVTANLRDRLLSLTLTDNRGFEADQLDIELDDADGQLALPVRGAVVKLFLGWQGQPLTGKGEFTVDEVEHHGAPDTLTIRARSADFRGTLNARREVSYHDTTLGAVVKQIAERNKLTPAIATDFTDIAVRHIDQTQETDAKFLTRLASLHGAVAAIKAGRLLFIRPGAGVTVSGKPIPQLTLMRQDGDRHSFSIADRGAYTGVTASWLHTRDPKPKKVKLQRKPKEKHLRALEHPAAKKKKTTAKKEPEAREGEYLAGSEDNVFALTTVYATKAAAMRAAKAKWEKLQRGVAEFSLTLAMGRADVFPETPVRVSGFKSVIDAQPWLISKVTHNLSGNGYTTTLDFEVLLSDVEYEVERDKDGED